MKDVIAMLDKIANSLQEKGLIDEATQIDVIANTIEAGLLGDVWKSGKDLIKPLAVVLSLLSGGAFAEGTSEFIQNIHAKMIDIQTTKDPAIQLQRLNDLIEEISQISRSDRKNAAIEKLEEFKDTLRRDPSKQKPVTPIEKKDIERSRI